MQPNFEQLPSFIIESITGYLPEKDKRMLKKVLLLPQDMNAFKKRFLKESYTRDVNDMVFPGDNVWTASVKDVIHMVYHGTPRTEMSIHGLTDIDEFKSFMMDIASIDMRTLESLENIKVPKNIPFRSLTVTTRCYTDEEDENSHNTRTTTHKTLTFDHDSISLDIDNKIDICYQEFNDKDVEMFVGAERPYVWKNKSFQGHTSHETKWF